MLLVTLLLFNALANETLPVFLGALVPNYLAVIISVTLVLVFGEILPSALFTGPNQLLIASKLVNLVYFLLALFYPVAFPISKLLDYWFGEEDNGNITRAELEALVILQSEEHKELLSRHNDITSESSFDVDIESAAQSVQINENKENLGKLSSQEVRLMTGILKSSHKKVREAMIPIEHVCMLSSSTKIHAKSLRDIQESGFSRIPVFKHDMLKCILGYLLVKELPV